MAALLLTPSATPCLSLEEVRAFCRVETMLEDDLLQKLIASATDLAQQATGQILLESLWQEDFCGLKARTIQLGKTPFKTLQSVRHTDQDGIVSLLEHAAHYTLRVQRTGEGVLDLLWPIGPNDRIEVVYRAGITQEPTRLGAGLRHALLRTVGVLFAQRDTTQPEAASAMVQALWQPYRIRRLY
jgi:uncharacterized phiE125 gp8 family phage protein